MTHVFTTPEELQSGAFILKTHQMFSVRTSPEEFENATIAGHFRFVSEEISVRKMMSLL